MNGGDLKDHFSRPDLGIQDLDRGWIAGRERLQGHLHGNDRVRKSVCVSERALAWQCLCPKELLCGKAHVRDPEHIPRAGGVLDLGRQLVTVGDSTK